MIHLKLRPEFLCRFLCRFISGALGIYILCVFNMPAHAFLLLGESGEVVPENQYRLGFHPQLKLSDGGGFHLASAMDFGLGKDMSVRAFLGTGNPEILLGGSFKWIPFPDYRDQPALGVKTELLFVRRSGESSWGARLLPLVSKKVDSEYGMFVPYGAYALNYVSAAEDKQTSQQFILGSEFRPASMVDWFFGGELGLNASRAFSFVSVYASFPIDFPNLKKSKAPTQATTPLNKGKS